MNIQLLFQPYKPTGFYVNSCHDLKYEILTKIHSKFKVKAEIFSSTPIGPHALTSTEFPAKFLHKSSLIPYELKKKYYMHVIEREMGDI